MSLAFSAWLSAKAEFCSLNFGGSFYLTKKCLSMKILAKNFKNFANFFFLISTHKMPWNPKKSNKNFWTPQAPYPYPKDLKKLLHKEITLLYVIEPKPFEAEKAESQTWKSWKLNCFKLWLPFTPLLSKMTFSRP